jgi:HlyD family secretion protein
MVRKLLVISAVIVVLAALVFFNIRSGRKSRAEVTVSEVARRDITRQITASGNIQPRKRVNVSASAIGKITRLAVEEGDHVETGDFLLEIDPTPYRSAVDQLRAAVRGARASLDVEIASLEKAKYDYEKTLELSKKEFVSADELRDAQIAVDIAEARVESARETLAQHEASLAKAQHELDQIRITAEMSGIITALNVEEGESAIMGTMNNPGTVLLTIADLSEMEAEVSVDETEVVFVEAGQDASVTLDAFPDTSFAGVVSEVGNSAIRGQLGFGQESVDFKVVVTITEAIPNIRPGLSASVDITVARAENVLTIPIQCLTVRDENALARSRRLHRRQSGDKEGAEAPADTAADESEEESQKDIEGVFVVADGTAEFRRIGVGITGQKYFEVETGLTEGESVVSGPFRVIGELNDGDAVKIRKQERSGTSRAR